MDLVDLIQVKRSLYFIKVMKRWNELANKELDWNHKSYEKEIERTTYITHIFPLLFLPKPET